MKQETIDRLLELAIEAFANSASPDAFAKAAAHEASFSAAHVYCPESADAAALIAAVSFVTKANEATLFSADITDAAMKSFAMKRHYQSAHHAFKGANKNQPARPASDIVFSSLLNASNESIGDTETEVTQSYRHAFVHDEAGNEKARRAALHTYSDCYTTTRAIFVRVGFSANKMQDATARTDVFKSLMSDRLNQELTYDTLNPSFFIQIMNSRAITVIASILLVAGILTIACGTFGVLGLPFIPTVAAGSVAAVCGVGLFASGFFAHRKLQQIDVANQQYEDMIVNDAH